MRGRARRDLPGHLLRRPVASATPTSSSRVDTPSDLGAWSYEVADTKLARRVKAGAILQMCDYSEHVARLQGVDAAHIHVITGDGEQAHREAARLRRLLPRAEARDFARSSPPATTRARTPTRSSTAASAVGTTSATTSAAPTTTSRSSPACAPTRSASSSPRRATPTDLAGAPAGPAVSSGDDAPSLERSATRPSCRCATASGVSAAALRGADPAGAPEPPPIPTTPWRWPKRGFAALPDAVARRPLLRHGRRPVRARDGGLEYLFGVVELPPTASRATTPFWAHDRAAEKHAFEAFIDFVMGDARRTRPARLPLRALRADRAQAPHGPARHARAGGRRAAARRALRRPLRGRAPGRAHRRPSGTRSSRSRSSTCSAAPTAIAEGARQHRRLRGLARSTATRASRRDRGLQRRRLPLHARLRDWLEARRAEAEVSRRSRGQRTPHAARRRASPPADGQRRADAATVRDRRAARPTGCSPSSCTGTAARRSPSGGPTTTASTTRATTTSRRPRVHRRSRLAGRRCAREAVDGLRYKFDPQDHKFSRGRTRRPGDRPSAGRSSRSTTDSLHLKRGTELDEPHPGSPVARRGPASGRRAIADVADSCRTNGIDAPGTYRAAATCCCAAPRLAALDAGAAARAGEATGRRPCRRARRVSSGDESTSRCRARPARARRTSGPRMIVDLVQHGKRVGITAHSHAVIGNLLE